MLQVDQSEPVRVLGTELETIDTVANVIEQLHPEAHGFGIGKAVSQIIKAIQEQELCTRNPFHGQRDISFTGSDARRLIGGTPEIWSWPGKFWSEIAQVDPELADNQIVTGIMRGGQWDTDIRCGMKIGASMDDLKQVIQSIRKDLPCSSSLEMKHHGASSQLRILLAGTYYVDVGFWPSYTNQGWSWREQNQDDARMSLALPFRLFGASCEVLDNGMVAIDSRIRTDFWFAPYTFVGAMHNLGLDGALTGWLRAKVTDAFWPPKHFVTNMPSYYATFSDSEFWANVHQNSMGRELRLADRAGEIATQALLLLTLDPNAGAAMRKDGILDHLQLGKIWDGNGIVPISDYRSLMANGTLSHSEIGPVQVAKQLRLSMKKFIELSHPII